MILEQCILFLFTKGGNMNIQIYYRDIDHITPSLEKHSLTFIKDGAKKYHNINIPRMSVYINNIDKKVLESFLRDLEYMKEVGYITDYIT